MRYAQVKNGVVVNIISLEDGDDVELFSSGFDAVVLVEGAEAIGWLYNGSSFTPVAQIQLDEKYNESGPL